MFLSRYIVVKTNNNWEKRGVPWVISEFTYFPQNIVFKSNLKAYYKEWQICYYKVWQLNILQSATSCLFCRTLYYLSQFVIKLSHFVIHLALWNKIITKCHTYFITKCDKCYYKSREVSQRVTVLLQSATGLTKCNYYYKVQQNRC